MKKALNLLVLSVLGVVSMVGITHGQLQPPNTYTDPTNEWGTTSVLTPGTGTGQQDSFINVVKGAINWVLGILAFIALIVLLWGGFQMVTAAGDDDKYKAGFKILKQAAVGLILIGVAWFILSLIFWLINLTTGSAGGSAGSAG